MKSKSLFLLTLFLAWIFSITCIGCDDLERAGKDIVRREQKLKKEEKEKRIAVATDLVRRFSDTLISYVSPYSNEDDQYEIVDTGYDYDTEKVELTFITTWMALPTGSEEKKEQHEIRARVTLYHDGTYFYKTIKMNDVLVRAINATRREEEWTQLLVELSKGNNQENTQGNNPENNQ